MAFFVRQYRNLLPTDPLWLSMTQEDIIREYWMIQYWELRKAGAPEGEETTQYEGAAEFERELAERGLIRNSDGEWIEVDPDEVEE